MERIRATPLPLVYVAHLRTFLLCYLLFMPLVYISHWQWGTIPAMALVSFALLGVEGAAAECESPFAQRANHLATDAYAAALVGNVSGCVLDTAPLLRVLTQARYPFCLRRWRKFSRRRRCTPARPGLSSQGA